VFTVYGGSVAPDGVATLSGVGVVVGWLGAVTSIWVLAASGVAWMMGTCRAQAAACMDGAGPRALGRVWSRTGVPAVMALVSGATAAVRMTAGLAGTGADAQKYFTVALTAAIAFDVLAYLLIFPSFVALRMRRSSWPRGSPVGLEGPGS
jgi:amino acid transporter